MLLSLRPLWSTLILIALLFRKLDPRPRRTALTWAVAFACLCLYVPLSPIFHSYQKIGIFLTASFNIAVLLQALSGAMGVAPSVRLVAVEAGHAGWLPCCSKPEFADYHAVRDLAVGERRQPPGYAGGSWNGYAAKYAWSDYKNTLDYLRRETGPDTRVANALLSVPAITYPTARATVFSNESLQFLINFDRPEDWDAYVAALENAPEDSVAVWDLRRPGQHRLPELPQDRPGDPSRLRARGEVRVDRGLAS